MININSYISYLICKFILIFLLAILINKNIAKTNISFLSNICFKNY